MKKTKFSFAFLLTSLLLGCAPELPTDWKAAEILKMKEILNDTVIPFYYIGENYVFNTPTVEILGTEQQTVIITNEEYPSDLFVRGYIRPCEKGGFEGVKSFDNLLIFTNGLSKIGKELSILLLFGCLVEGVKEDLQTALDSLLSSVGIPELDFEIPLDEIPEKSAFFYALPLDLSGGFDIPEFE